MTNEELPEPLLDSSVKTGSMGSMLLDFSRLINSDFYALSTGDEFKAALTLWAAAWAQTPAGSLPADERILAALSRAKSWKKVRDRALHGFILCSDDRYYHAVLCEKALDVSKKIEEFSKKSEKNLLRKQKERAERAELIAKATELGMAVDSSMGTTQLRELIDNSKNNSEIVTRDSDVTQRDSHAYVTQSSRCIKEKKRKEKKLKEIKALDQEQEQELLRARAEELKKIPKKVLQQSESESAAASQLPAAVAACTFENLDCESLEPASDLTQPALSKKAVSKRGKAQKTTSGGIDLSNLPPQISVMAAETLIAHRKAKRSPFVQVSFDRFVVKVLEASVELSFSADDVIFEMIDAGWTGFRTDWLKNRLQSGQKFGGNSRQKFGAMSETDKQSVRASARADFLDDFGGVNPVTGTVLIEDIEYAKL